MASAAVAKVPGPGQNPASMMRSNSRPSATTQQAVTLKTPPQLPPRPPAKVRQPSETTQQAMMTKQPSKKKSIVESLTYVFGGPKESKRFNNNDDAIEFSNPAHLPKPMNTKPMRNPSTTEQTSSKASSPNTVGSLPRRASSITQEVSRRASSIRWGSKKNSILQDENGLIRKASDLTTGQSGSTRHLSARLSYARAKSDRGLARPNRKKSESIFTKEEQRHIRMAATEATISWDDESRTSDDTSISGGEEENKKRPTVIISVQNVYKDSSPAKTDFEVVNPSQNDHHFGMLFFSGGLGSTVIEEDED